MDKGYYKKSHYVHLWIHLLFKANHEGKKVLLNNKEIEIKRGQFLTGRKELSIETGISQSTVERILSFFENEHQIEQQKTNLFRIITITNYIQMQKSGHHNGQPVDNQWTTSGQPVDTNKELKELKNIYREEILEKNSQLTERFQEKIKILKDEISEESYKQWIVPLLFVCMEDDKVILYHETPIWVQENYASMIEKIIGKSVKIINAQCELRKGIDNG